MNTDDWDEGQSTVASAALSAEFLEGNTEADLEKLRTRLLDLTNRNCLLSFRHSASSSLRIVNIDTAVRLQVEQIQLVANIA
jgi:hypothetical protein